MTVSILFYLMFKYLNEVKHHWNLEEVIETTEVDFMMNPCIIIENHPRR